MMTPERLAETQDALAHLLVQLKLMQPSSHYEKKLVRSLEVIIADYLVQCSEVTRLTAENAELQRNAACPCCKKGVNFAGEPCQECKGSGWVAVAYDVSRMRYKRLDEENAELRQDPARLLNVARGCHDYGGGYRLTAEVEVYHHGIQTVIQALEHAVRDPGAMQVCMLESMGAAMQATAKGGAE